MTSLYISTCRKPTQKTRILAKMLARLLNGKYENRGKRGVSEVAGRAEALGMRRIAFVYEKHGNADRIAFWDGEWLPEEILVKGFEEFKCGRVEGEVSGTAGDKQGRRMMELFCLEEGGGEIEASFSAKEITLEMQGNAALKVKVELKEQ